MWMDFLERKVSINESNALWKTAKQQLHGRCRLLAVRTLKISVLDDSHRRMDRAQNMVGRINRNSKIDWPLVAQGARIASAYER